MTPHNVYEPNAYLKKGVYIWGEMFKELWDARELIVRLFLRNFSARYKQALLGIAWAVLMPIIAIGTFVLLKRVGILDIGPTQVPYPLFALIGLSVFQIFSSGLSSGCTALVEAGDMLAKVNFPRETLILAVMANALFEFMIKIVLIALLCLFFGYLPPIGAFLFPLAVLPIVFLTLGLAFIVSLAHAVFRDTAPLISVGTMFLMFLTPVLYPVTAKNMFFFKLNPLTALVEAPRDLLAYGYIREPIDFVAVSIFSLLIFLISWRIFHVAETKIPERI